MQVADKAWAGVDAGKGHHHVCLIDAEGRRLLSRRVANGEAELAAVIAETATLASEVTWAIDLADGGAELLITMLLNESLPVFYLPGLAVNRASAGYRGEGKTDAKDAAVIADQARMRVDLRPLRAADELVTELAMLTAYRADLAGERTRTINRLRNRLMSIFPALEGALDFTNQGPLILVSAFQTPASIRLLGQEGLRQWLREHKVRCAPKLAEKAVRAAQAQQCHMGGEGMAADIIGRLARSILELDRQIADVDDLISEKFARHRHAAILTSLPGVGTLLGAEFLTATGGNMDAFASADHLAGYAGLAPTPRDSGRRSGNLHRPKRYNRQLQRMFYTSALISIQTSPSSRNFYDRKRAQGKRHTQAVLALARRRVNVVWALLRDQQPYEERTSAATPIAA